MPPVFAHGALRLYLLALLESAPKHGYELIKSIEGRFGGAYSPSPGVIYPTLAWLDDMGYALVEPAEGGRKLYRITPEGEAFLSANKALLDELVARGRAMAPGGKKELPQQVLRAMENLKLAMRLRLKLGLAEQEVRKRFEAAFAGDLRLGAAFGFIRQI